MIDQLTDSQRKWHDLAAKHADDFATRAAQHDEENSYPFENMQALRDSGYTAMPIPVDAGGGEPFFQKCTSPRTGLPRATEQPRWPLTCTSVCHTSCAT